MKPCISEATTLSSTFAEDVNGYADGGCQVMEVWLTKLETHLEKHSTADTRKLLEDRQMTLAAASYQGGLLLAQGEQRRAHCPACFRETTARSRSVRPTRSTKSAVSSRVGMPKCWHRSRRRLKWS